MPVLLIITLWCSAAIYFILYILFVIYLFYGKPSRAMYVSLLLYQSIKQIKSMLIFSEKNILDKNINLSGIFLGVHELIVLHVTGI